MLPAPFYLGLSNPGECRLKSMLIPNCIHNAAGLTSMLHFFYEATRLDSDPRV